MKLLLLLLAAQAVGPTHEAISYVGYNVAEATITYTTKTHDRTEATVAVREFSINLKNGTMSSPFEARKLTEKEQRNVSLVMVDIVSAFEKALKEKGVTYIQWFPEQKSISVSAKKGKLITTIDIEGKVNNSKVKNLKELDKEVLFAYSTALLQYTLDSTEWWDKGEEVLNNKKAERL